ncbi:hypothetical protein HETIRDRAFT_314810 [Heterobasidion irregulare TC 32-1]|uniref:Uncharacterized protein n=1 Tax=Heterobasidion irregulare (strain TC 32-1) TaxID=747525 RepID=W4K9J5_HETIT|nr:uncharacterized protein HETIRDRAFT_314810 [Heterobasidion irregulare TC 32-1]ETW82453.1 hypothetical protein HETIRDRAFT_314810 [Heterobasidion irregulare TC 32-1]
MPWDNTQTDLGNLTWNFNKFLDPEVIELHHLCRVFALAEIPLRDHGHVWVTISLDHLTQEPDALGYDSNNE